MRRHLRKLLLVVTASLAPGALLTAHPAHAFKPAPDSPTTAAASPAFDDVIARVVGMPSDGNLQSRANRWGLNVLNVVWEDTGRFENSAVGPNISDLTLQVRQPVGRHGLRTHLLPVIRHPNFTDKTGDVAADKLRVRVGNQRQGGALTAVPLKEVLGSLREYLTDPSSMHGSGNLLAPRDTHVLVSAQHVFLPLPETGKVEFNPVLFNYQSAPGAPAVLTLLVTRQGTSATVIENRAGDQTEQGWGQQLFFNKGGQKTAFTAERHSAVKARIQLQGEQDDNDRGALEEGADMMMIVQVPLKQPQRRRQALFGDGSGLGALGGAPAMEAPAAAEQKAMASRGAVSDVEKAVLGHGRALGRFTEINGLRVERDPRFPVRVTVQFYRATSNGVVSDQDLAAVHHAIEQVYQNADYVGSLVVPSSERNRPTDWIKDTPAGAWGIAGK